eukprot:TRINITY_DN358_c0_g1_i4.p1 TRINITY_DN358_c0_g1~~TRINITY_DN358_c0_g1_i4.p1  ORF type:complete len:437 (+),score=48.62 TRINITY_DN358_c0_g1_i4:94-1404(+)
MASKFTELELLVERERDQLYTFDDASLATRSGERIRAPSPLDFLANASVVVSEASEGNFAFDSWNLSAAATMGHFRPAASHSPLAVTDANGDTVPLSPSSGDSVPWASQFAELARFGQRKCANRECQNPGGQPDKPRSIYCSKRCQSREQNLRQGRIKHVNSPGRPPPAAPGSALLEPPARPSMSSAMAARASALPVAPPVVAVQPTLAKQGPDRQGLTQQALAIESLLCQQPEIERQGGSDRPGLSQPGPTLHGPGLGLERPAPDRPGLPQQGPTHQGPTHQGLGLERPGLPQLSFSAPAVAQAPIPPMSISPPLGSTGITPPPIPVVSMSQSPISALLSGNSNSFQPINFGVPLPAAAANHRVPSTIFFPIATHLPSQLPLPPSQQASSFGREVRKRSPFFGVRVFLGRGLRDTNCRMWTLLVCEHLPLLLYYR